VGGSAEPAEGDPSMSVPPAAGTAAFKADLHRYLRIGRQALLWKLDGLSEYDARRPLTPTGTNLLGLIKHLALVEGGYFGVTFGRPFPERLEGGEPDDEPNADMWARPEESRQDVLGLYERVCLHADATIEALSLEAVGRVPWWRPEQREVTLHRILVHVTTELHRHAGHADIVRELIDGAVGLRPDNTNVWLPDGVGRTDHRERLEAAARTFVAE